MTFNLLCEQYKLKEAHEGYWLLKDFFEHRIKGEAFTDEEIASDFTAMEIASMLLLLRGKIKFKIEADHGCSITITDKRMIESLVGYLNMELNKRVNKRGNIVEEKGGDKKCLGPHLILNKGYGGGGTGRAYLIPYPLGCAPQKEGFSDKELEAIIHYEAQLKESICFFAGNANTRNPEIGKMSSWIISLLPNDWTRTDRNCFVFDYLSYSGFLDFKGDVWKMKFIGKGDRKNKCTQVKDWINSYVRSTSI